MANWADTAPNESTAYVTVLTNLRDRDKDAAKMFVVDPTNPIENFIRYNRASNKFQEYLSAAWADKVLSVAGGGTGGSTASAARTALGLGTMAVQNNNAVDIDGGDIASAVTINAASLTAGLVAQARLGSGSSGTGLLTLLDNQTWGVSTPVGSGFIWYTAVAPSGFLICDGSVISRATYSALFAVIGVTFGVGDGSTTFSLPDTRQRFLLGKAASGTGSVFASQGGMIDHNHIIVADGAHTHTGPSHTHTGPSHTHAAGTLVVASHNHGGGGTTGNSSAATSSKLDGSGTNAASAPHTHAFTIASSSPAVNGSTDTEGTGATGSSGTGATSSNGSHSHLGFTFTENPPFLTVTFIIKY